MDTLVRPLSAGPQNFDRGLATDLRPGRTKGLVVAVLYRVYKYVVGPALHALGGGGAACRFSPSCSDYAREAFENHGALKALRLSVWRVLRCNPWNQASAFDPVPSAIPTKEFA